MTVSHAQHFSCLRPGDLRASAWQGFPSEWGDLSGLLLPPGKNSLRDGLGDWAASWFLACVLFPLSIDAPGALVCCPHCCPRRPGQGPLWLPTVTLRPSLSGQRSLPPPHTQTSRLAASCPPSSRSPPPLPTWGPSAHCLRGAQASACLTTTERSLPPCSSQAASHGTLSTSVSRARLLSFF